MSSLRDQISDEIVDELYDYLRSDGPGGKQVINAFLEEFDKLADRSPPDDPTNLKYHKRFLTKHVKETWDNSLRIESDGSISIGVGKDDVLGFDLNRDELRHKPKDVVWTVFLIRGIAGRYAFVGEQEYLKRYNAPMPSEYARGFLITEGAWERERWDEFVGPFSAHEHPASGAGPIPFFKNVIEKVDVESMVSKVLDSMEAEKV